MLKKYISLISPRARKIILASVGASIIIGAVAGWYFFIRKENFQGDLVFGVVSDIHASAKNNPSVDTVKTKRYSETLPYFVGEMSRIRADFAIELGDFTNGTERNTAGGTKDFELVNGIYAGIPNRYYVLGNHDVIALNKDEFRRMSGMAANYYSFERKGYKFIVLDAQFNPEGTEMGPGLKKHIPGFIPETEKQWLEEELRKSDKPVILFSHQPLFSVDPNDAKLSFITNAADIKNILAANRDKILGFFSGHNHRPAIREEAGIKYVFVPSMAYTQTSGAYAVIELSGTSMEVNFLVKGRKIKPLP